MEQALKSELSGDFLKLTLAIGELFRYNTRAVFHFLRFTFASLVECVQNQTAYFAKQLHDADERTFIRILVSRSEIDLANIMKEYERLYDRTLQSDIKVS